MMKANVKKSSFFNIFISLGKLIIYLYILLILSIIYIYLYHNGVTVSSGCCALLLQTAVEA